MKTLRRAFLILVAGCALGAAMLPLGGSAWAGRERDRRGPPRRAAPADTVEQGTRRPQMQGRRIGLFSHFRAPSPSRLADTYRLIQVGVIQMGVPAGLTLLVLGLARRKRPRAAP
jgi:hypothetical protein